MTAFNVTLEIDQGSTFSKSFTWKTGDPALPVNLTGCTAKMQFRPTASSSTVILELTTENSMITLGAALGTVVLTISDELTSTLPTSTAVHDLKIYFSDGTSRRLLQGVVLVKQAVTKEA